MYIIKIGNTNAIESEYGIETQGDKPIKKSIYYIPPSLKHDYETIYLLFLQEVLLYMY